MNPQSLIKKLLLIARAMIQPIKLATETMNKTQKKPAVLLEVIIALSLLVLVMTPLVRGPILFHRATIERIEKIEADRIAAWTFTEIREKLLNQEFRWEQLPPMKEKGKKFELPTVVLDIPSASSKSFQRNFSFTTLKEKEHEGKVSRLISVSIQIGAFKNTYELIVEKASS